MKTKFVLLILFTISLSCTSVTDDIFKVEYKGALKEIMFESDISARMNLKSLHKKEHLYALGAVENLKGEILILDGKSYVSSKKNNSAVTDTSFTQKAALIVYTQIKEWVDIQLPATITTQEELETFLPKVAKEKGINTNKPFPFQVVGNTLSINWHIIDWKDGDTEHTHEKHAAASINGNTINVPMTVLGFHSEKHHRIWTHHSSNVHMHVYIHSKNMAAHVDELLLKPGSILRLPKMK